MDPYFRGKLLRHCHCGDERTACTQFRHGFDDSNRDRANDVPAYMNPWSWYHRSLKADGKVHGYVTSRCHKCDVREAAEAIAAEAASGSPPAADDTTPPAADATAEEEPRQQGPPAPAPRGQPRMQTLWFPPKALEFERRQEERAMNMTEATWGPRLRELAKETRDAYDEEHRRRAEAARRGWATRRRRQRSRAHPEDPEDEEVPEWLKWQ